MQNMMKCNVDLRLSVPQVVSEISWQFPQFCDSTIVFLTASQSILTTAEPLFILIEIN